MQLHLFLNAEYPAGVDLRPKVEDHIRQAQMARDFGFVGVAVGQHLSVGDLQWFPPVPFLTYLAGRLPEMRLTTSVALIPYFNPLLLAETFAFLDVLSDGRLTIGVGPGWAPHEFHALGIDRSQRVETFERNIMCIDRLLRGEEIEVDGSDGEVRSIRLGLRPVQRPRPPIWVGASTPRSARRLAKFADTFVMSSHIPLDRQVEIRNAFLDGKGMATDEPLTTPVLRNVFVGKTREAALEKAMPYLESSYSHFDDWGLFSGVLRESRKSQRFPDTVLGRVIIGDPHDVAEGLRLTSERLRTDTIALRMQWRGMSSDDVEDSIRLLGNNVLPML